MNPEFSNYDLWKLASPDYDDGPVCEKHGEYLVQFEGKMYCPACEEEEPQP